MKKNSTLKCDRSLPNSEGGGRVFFLHLLGGGWVFFFLLSLFVSCRKEVKVSPEEQARRDSAALHVALMPVQDCLPFYIAQQTGVYERLGLDVRIHTLQAQLDTDTAIAKGHVHAAYSDLARAIMLQQDTVAVRAVAAFDGELRLVTMRRGRIRQLGQLKEKMVAVARHSITDYWSDRLTDSAAVKRSEIFRPQINDVRIRTDMLCNGTMDAAFLPEPYATEAVVRGNKENFSTRGQQPRLVALLATTQALADADRRRQLQLLMQGYEEVVTKASQTTALADSLPSLLRELCQTPDSLALRVAQQLPAFKPLASPKGSDAEAALEWLRRRGKVKKGYAIDSLFADYK